MPPPDPYAVLELLRMPNFRMFLAVVLFASIGSSGSSVSMTPILT